LPLERLVRTYPLEAAEKAARAMKAGQVVKPILIP